jgi:hypothetical protein
MPKITFALILAGLVAAAHAGAADEPAKKPDSTNKIDRAVEKSGAALGRTADKVEKKVIKGAEATEKAINTTGKKVGEWFNKKAKTD